MSSVRGWPDAESSAQPSVIYRQGNYTLPMSKNTRYWWTSLRLIGLHLGALAALIPNFFSWPAIFVMLALVYATSGLGIAFCYHRLLTHRSFKVPIALEYFTALLGTLTLQGSPLHWVGTHRIHHAYSDTDQDPHDSNRGLSWSHIQWLYMSNPRIPTKSDVLRMAPELGSNQFYALLDRNVLSLQIAVAIVLFAAGGISFVIWGVFVRLVLTFHVTWLINSAGHSSGYQTFRSHDRSMNCWWLTLLAWGEGWHNNHHAFPSSARVGLAWFEFDITWLTIALLRAVGIATGVKVPSDALQDRLRLKKVVQGSPV